MKALKIATLEEAKEKSLQYDVVAID